MGSSEDFDAFYKATRDRLLLQTFALTGDLAAARRSVRDAYVAAWHHWHKVGRQPQPEAWVRPHAWTDAQRRHSARIWRRDKGLDAGAQATLGALAKLTGQQRRALLLNHLSTTALPELAREIGLTQETAERTLQSAASQYAVHRATASTRIHAELNGLASVTAGTAFPRASIIRRAGAARRRTFTAVGVGVALVALVASGMLVTDRHGVAPNLSEEEVIGTAAKLPKAEPDPVRLEAAQLLTADQATRLSPERTWQARRTTPNTTGDGLYTSCQGARFADPKGAQAMVRAFSSEAPKTTKSPKSTAAVTAVQATELSNTPKRAREAYAETVGWYAGCRAPRTQLLAAYDVEGVGDQASLFLLRTWGSKPGTLTVAVARTRRITTTTARRTALTTEAPQLPELDSLASLLAAAVNRVCGTPGSGTCAGPPRLTEVPPPAIGEAAGLLDAVDLPQAGAVNASWVGTEPRRALQNLATIACDDSDFSKAPVSNGMTRSYLMVGARLPRRFGITETVGTLPTPGAARRFVAGVRSRMDGCEDEDLASTVSALSDEAGARVEIAAWRVDTEVNDSDTVNSLMAIVRRGNAVAQIGFVTAPGATFDAQDFEALAERAVQRLAYLPNTR